MARIALLHAFPLSPEMFEGQRRVLESDGHEVVVPDLLAAPPPNELPGMSGLASRVVAAIDELAMGGSFAVAGLSLGGYVAMELLRQVPHRITGMALLDTKATTDPEPAAQARLAYAQRVVDEGMAWVPEAALPGLLGETTRETRPGVVAKVTAWIKSADPAAVAWTQRAMAARPDSTAELAVFRRPSLVVVGQEDTLSPPADALAMAQALGGAPLVEIGDCGHLSAVETPGRVSQALSAWAGRLIDGAA